MLIGAIHKNTAVLNCVGGVLQAASSDVLRRAQEKNSRQIHRYYANASSSSASHVQRPCQFIPRRALMYVPGDDTRKLRKASQLRVDFIALDCEDGVAVSRKKLARDTIRAFYDSNLNEMPTDHTQHQQRQSEWSVRVNSIASGLCDEDLRVIVSGKRVPESLLLPKCESADDLKCFSELLRRHCNVSAIKHRLALIIFAESCSSIMNLPAICRAAVDIANESDCLFELAGIVFGSDDFCADIGATRTASSLEILYARQRVVLVAKAFGLQAIDMVHIDYKDAVDLKAQSLFGAQMGYTGKQIIHPDQIDIVQDSFLPSSERVNWARGLLKAFEQHQKDGKGAFEYHNQMIDMPTMRQAQNIIDTMNNIK